MNSKLKNAISVNWNGLNDKEIETLANKIHSHDGEKVYNSTYNRWYFYKFSDGSIRVSRLTWDYGSTKTMESFEDVVNFLDWYFS